MSEKTRRQVILLLCLAVVLAVMVGYRLWVATPAVPGGASSNPLAGVAAADGKETVVDVRLDLLQHKPGEYQPAQRNPFRFYVPPAPVAVRPAPPTTLPPPPPGPPQPPPLARIRVRFFGFFVDKDGKTTAWLTDEASGAVIPGKAGDIILGRYRLLSVSPDVVVVSYLDGQGRQSIPLTGR